MKNSEYSLHPLSPMLIACPFCFIIFSVYICVCQLLSRVCLLGPHRLLPVRLLCPWDSPGTNTGRGCHSFLQGIFPIQGSNPDLLYCRQVFTSSATSEAYVYIHTYIKIMHISPLNSGGIFCASGTEQDPRGPFQDNCTPHPGPPPASC